MSKEIDHEVFGKVIYNGYSWEIEEKIKVKLFNIEHIVLLTLEGEEEGSFDEGQIESYTNIKKNIEALLIKAEKELFNYYKEEVFEEYHVPDDDFWKIAVPYITKKDDLVDLITDFNNILIHSCRDIGERSIGLLFECTWDEEHGLGVLFNNEKIINIGEQSIAF